MSRVILDDQRPVVVGHEGNDDVDTWSCLSYALVLWKSLKQKARRGELFFTVACRLRESGPRQN